MHETWKAVPGLEGQYEASDLGRIRSLDRVVSYTYRRGRNLRTVSTFKRGRVLRPGRVPSGHLTVVIGGTNRQVHEVVLTTFVGPCPAGFECCHENDIPADNRLENLRWDTRSSHRADSFRNGRSARGESHHLSKLTEVDVQEIRRALKLRERGTSIADRYGVSSTTIYRIKDQITWRHV